MGWKWNNGEKCAGSRAGDRGRTGERRAAGVRT
jgi:hypothetical protein